MRWCANCRKFNSGKPLRCGFCGQSLSGRLCERNHINPADPKLAFCGDCGKPLEKPTASHGFPIPARPALIVAGVVVGGIVIWRMVAAFDGSILIIPLVILGLLRLLFKLLPVSLRNF